MKYGVRKPNIKKSIKAQTTGKVKRQMKKAVNPLYGKKGMGVINDPKKAAYNAIYNRTTVSATDVLEQNNENHPPSNDSLSAGDIISLIGNIFGLLFSLIKAAFWLVVLIGIIALLIWIF